MVSWFYIRIFHMKTELISRFESARQEAEGTEYWSARKLQVILWYAKWENFQNALEKAKESCRNAWLKPQDHFLDVREMVELGSGAKREVNDILLA